MTIKKSDTLHYYPALTEFSFSFSTKTNFNMTFANGFKPVDSLYTFADLVNNASSTSKTVNANWKEITRFSRENNTIKDLLQNPLDMTLRTANSNMYNQEFLVNDKGILGRKHRSTGETDLYEDEQIAIINNIIISSSITINGNGHNISGENAAMSLYIPTATSNVILNNITFVKENIEDVYHELFDKALEEYIIPFKNDPDVFGTQLILDSEDQVIGFEDNLLVNATLLDLDSLYSFANCFNALVYPAHIDREANGIVSVLGTIPREPEFSAYEFHFASSVNRYISKFSSIGNKPLIISSDAHFLWDINEAVNSFELFDSDYSSNKLRESLFLYFRGEKV